MILLFSPRLASSGLVSPRLAQDMDLKVQ